MARACGGEERVGSHDLRVSYNSCRKVGGSNPLLTTNPPGFYNGEFIYTEPRLSIRVNTCGDGGGRSGKTDIISPFFNELGNIHPW